MKNFKDRLRELNSDVEDLWSRAYRDSLTNLLNRSALEDELLTEFNKLSESSEYSFAVLYMDLNGFKKVNDTFGHNTGDAVLVEVARRLKGLQSDNVFRLGGDEFVMIATGTNSVDDALELARQIDVVLSEVYRIESEKCYVAPSVGVVYCDDKTKYGPDVKIAIRDILHDADQTMYQAKVLSKTSLFMPDVLGTRDVSGRYLLFDNKPAPELDTQDYKSILRDGIGTGRITSNGLTRECDFKFVQYVDGEIRLSCIFHLDNKDIVWAREMFGASAKDEFEGIVELHSEKSKCLITCLKLLRSNVSLRRADDGAFGRASYIVTEAALDFKKDLASKIRFYLTNLRVPENTFNGEHLLRIDLKNTVINIGIFGVTKGHNKLTEELKDTNGINVTCWAEMELSSASEASRTAELMDDICILLSLLQGSTTSWISYDLFSSSGSVLHSACRNSITGSMSSRDTSGIWTNSNVSHSIPVMYENFLAQREKWGLEGIVSMLAKAGEQGDFTEIKALKIVYCIELLLNAYLKIQGTPTEDHCGFDDSEAFSERLHQMCCSLELDTVKIEGLSEHETLDKVVRGVALLREWLHRDGTLNVCDNNSDYEVHERLGYERWRRLQFLKSFIMDCLRKILDPNGNYVLCHCSIDEERYDGVLSESKNELGSSV